MTPYARRSAAQVSFLTQGWGQSPVARGSQSSRRWSEGCWLEASLVFGGRGLYVCLPQLMQFGSLFRKRSQAHLPFCWMAWYTVFATQL